VDVRTPRSSGITGLVRVEEVELVVEELELVSAIWMRS